MAFQSRAVGLPEFYLLGGGGGQLHFLKGVDHLEWSKRLLQGGSQLVLSIHINQVLFLPTTNWLTSLTYHQIKAFDMFVSQFVVGRKRT